MDDIKLFDYDNPTPFLNKVKELEALLFTKGIYLFLYAGTLLGSVREGGLLKHDDDIDLFYTSKKSNLKACLNEFDSIIEPLLRADGWEVKPISWTLYTAKRMLGQYHVIKDGISLDLWMAWFDKNNNFHATMLSEDSGLKKSDIFPANLSKINDVCFNVPNNSELFLEHQYGKDWRTPDSKYKNKCRKNFLQKNVLKVIDQFGWAYFFIAKAQQKYSYQDIEYRRLQDIKTTEVLSNDIIYFHSPCMGQDKINQIISRVNRNKCKIIGAYGGENDGRYKDADLIVTISFPFLNKLKSIYPQKTCIFLPEATDVNYFYKKQFNPNTFEVGYVGRPCKVKRTHLLDELSFNVNKHMNWGKTYFTEDRTLDAVRDFYQSIDCLILTSQSECMPGVVLEAMATGLPVISTDVGCIRMLLEPEWIVPNSSESDIVKNINDKLFILQKYPEIRKKVGNRNRKHIKTYFNWETTQPLWDEVFNALFLNNYDRINEIGRGIEEQWEVIYKDYTRKPRYDLEAVIVNSNLEPIYKSPEEVIYELIRKTILLSKTCLSVIKDKVLNEKDIYLGYQQKDKDEVIELILKNGFLNSFDNLYTKDDYAIHLQEYSYPVKTYGVNGVESKIPFPVISYLDNTFGKDWQTLDNKV